MQEPEPTPSYRIEIPDFAVVLLIGVSGSGKSTFAAKHFLPTEVLSSDAFRALVSDDENDQAATRDAFEALHYVASVRLRRRKSVVVDATNVQPESRKPLLQLARQHDCLAVALVLDVPERVCQTRNRARADRQFGPRVIAVQQRQMRQSFKNLRKEGFRYVFTLNEAQIAHAEVVRMPLWTDRRAEYGPFDIIGDVHGCYDELVELLGALGYAPEEATGAWRHPEGRRVVFVGDLVDRGPKVVETVRLAWAMIGAGTALWVPGNHDNKLMRALKGNAVNVTHGLAESLRQIEALPPEEREAFTAKYIPFTDALVSHLWLDEGRLCVAHAGMKEEYIGRASSRVREFALYGDTTGETDEFGLPVRYPWAQDYRGATTVVYGHTPVPEADWLNNTINIDSGCVFGGKLTALRWPEREIVQVPAHATYAEPARPFPSAEPATAGDSDLIALQALARDAAEFPTLAEMRSNKEELQARIGQMEQALKEMESWLNAARQTGDVPLAEQIQEEKLSLQNDLKTMRKVHHLLDQFRFEDGKMEEKWLQVQERVQALRRQAALTSLLSTMKAAQNDFRELAVEVLTHRNYLSAQFNLTEQICVELERKAASERESGNPDLAQRLLEEKARRTPIVAEWRSILTAAEEIAGKVKQASVENEDRLHRLHKQVTALSAGESIDHSSDESESKQATEAEQNLPSLKERLARLGTLIEESQIQSVEREIQREIQKVTSRLSSDAQGTDPQEEWMRMHVRSQEQLDERRRKQEEIQARAERTLADMERRWADAFERASALQSEIKAGQGPKQTVPGAKMLSLQWQHDELLRAEDVLGKRFITTRLMHNVTVPAENAAAALEVMSRFAVEPRWLIYLPPTMSPCETAPEGDALERPAEAFAYYRQQGVGQVVCQRKHMGSRAVGVICRDAEAARRFGATAENGLPGQCYTRTGRQFFDDPALQTALLEEVSAALTRAGFWEEFATDWFCLDCELMPWNAKAQELLREQYAPVGAAAQAALSRSIEVVEAALARGVDMTAALESLHRRQEDVTRYAVAYGHYCWDVAGLADLRLAPFHLLATEGRTYFDRDHAWHATTLARLAEHSPLFLATEMQAVNTLDEASQAEGAAWWQALTEAGGEGMVVKPLEFIARGRKGLAQPAVKVRGREYLRIIYGPEYTEPANLERLRQRSLHAKRSLALREFALGVEGLERFVRKEPLRRVHECVFGVLALESEPVDPRL